MKILRESGEKYRTLFDSIDAGFCIIEMICDRTSKSVDWLFVEINSAFEKNNGIKEARGKTMLELVPDSETKGLKFTITSR